MFSGSKKPYSAVTVQIERLTSEQYEVDDSSGIVDLVEVIQIQTSGPSEASRALRKKLKYGDIHRQLRALTILDFLIGNAGDRFLRSFADEPLLERLRVAATDPVSDPEVKKKCRTLFTQWANTYSGQPGMDRITALYQQLPKRKKPMKQAQSKVLRETEGSHDDNREVGRTVSVSAGNGPSTILSTPTPKTSSSKFSSSRSHKKSKEKSSRAAPIDIEKERPQILQTIASASVAGTNLTNALKLVNRENMRVSEDPEVMERFEKCKELRRQILRYIQRLEGEEFLGGLIHANEELVNALITFEVLDKSVDNDSDSDSEGSPIGEDMRNDIGGGIAGLSLHPPAKPPRPSRPTSIALPLPSNALGKQRAVDSDSEESEEEEDDDEDNPFGDRNAVATPAVEKSGLTWRDV